MSDAAIVTIVTGVVTIATLWIKMRYSDDRAEDIKAKLDANTEATKAVESKADTIVRQTNGTQESIQKTVDKLSDVVAALAARVDKLEDYNHDSAHRVLNAINDMHLKIQTIVATQQAKKEE